MTNRGKDLKTGPGRCRALAASLSLAVGISLAGACTSPGAQDKIHYAMEMNGQVFGYVELGIEKTEEAGQPLLQLREVVGNRYKALGVPVDTQGWSDYRIDPATGRLSSVEQAVESGGLKLRITASIEGNAARIDLQPGGGVKMVPLPEDVLFENPYYFPRLVGDSGPDDPAPKVYRALDLLDRNIHSVRVTKRGPESVEIAGKTYRAIIVESVDLDVGLKIRQWVNADDGYLLKSEGPRSTQWIAGRSMKNKVQRADLDNHLFAKAGAAIADIPAISYLKVRAKLEPVGNWITPDGLRVPGQTFEGTVEENMIDGDFEVRHEKYDGRDAPPFPADFSGDPELQAFLAPEDFIESDDPVLVKKAQELAEGSKDAWEAVQRLARWVAEEIGYDIPGGASARNTYDVGEGECGAHSRLMAAFCRGVGIPARVVWGCMYVSNLGGSFGQHAWNEVYMGERGWVPLDTTAREVDYADSGHIRLGVLKSAHIALNPKQMEILDFQAGRQHFGGFEGEVETERYRAFLGRYKGPRGIVTVSVQDGGLNLTLADKRAFGLRDPDDTGEWKFKLSPDVGVTFERDASGGVAVMTIVNRVRLPKKEDPASISERVPENLRSYLGRYSLPMQKEELVVGFDGGRLTVHLPGLGVRRLEGPDARGVWSAGPGDERFSFVKDGTGQVRAMILIENIRNARIDGDGQAAGTTAK
jgi:transglutaminase-like putative cysteine protease